jgi:hypothetical protein
LSGVLFDRWARAVDEASKSQSPRLLLEMAAVDLCFSEPLEPIGDLLERFEVLETRLQSGAVAGGGGAGPSGARSRPSVVTAPAASPMPASGVPPARREPITSAAPTVASAATAPRPVVAAVPVATPPAVAVAAAAVEAAPASPAEIWRRILSAFEAQRPRLAGLLAHAEVGELAPGRLSLLFPDRFALDSAEKARAEIEQSLTAAFGQPSRVTMSLGGGGAAAPPILRSEVRAETDVLNADRKNRESEARQHPIIRKAQDVFGASLKEIKT